MVQPKVLPRLYVLVPPCCSDSSSVSGLAMEKILQDMISTIRRLFVPPSSAQSSPPSFLASASRSETVAVLDGDSKV